MADPLSIASGAAGLFSLSLEVTKLSRTYISNVRGAPHAMSSYLLELRTLSDLLLRIMSALQTDQIDNQRLDPNTNALDAALAECRREVEIMEKKLQKKTSLTGIRARISRLAYPFSEPELQMKVNMLNRYNSMFSSALETINLSLAVANNKELRNMGKDDKRRDIIAWFKPGLDMGSTISHLDDYCDSTCLSSLTNAAYLEWRNGLTDRLWINGQPGAGKSMLSGNRPHETLINVLRSLVAQALHNSPSIPGGAEELKKRNNQNFTAGELFGILTSIARTVHTYVVLDGMDECPFIKDLLSKLSTLESTGVSLLVTSRDLPKIREKCQGYTNMEVSATSQDLNRYVSYRLKHAEVDFELVKQELIADITSAIHTQATGSFLLARLALDHIVGLLTIRDIRKSLASIPSNFEEAYKSTIARISNQAGGLKQLALESLGIVCNVKRPLKMNELQHALAAREDIDEVGEDDIISSDAILSSCLGRLVLSVSDQPIEFVHLTAKNFIQSTNIGIKGHPDLTLSQICIRYMSTPEMRLGRCTSIKEMQERLNKQPFLRYAACFYGYHVQPVEEDCIPQIARFLEDANLQESSWQITNLKEGFDASLAKQVFESSPKEASHLHIAAFWGFSEYLGKKLADTDTQTSQISKTDLDRTDSHGWTPLHWAASMGHTSVVEILLKAGASPHLPDLGGWTPIFWAASKGHDDVIEILLRYHAVAFTRDLNGFTPLHWATWADHGKVVQRLVREKDEDSAGPNMKVTCYQDLKHLTVSKAQALGGNVSKSPLELYSGFEDVQLLLDLSVVDAKDIKEYGLFRQAVQIGNTEIISEFISHGANPMEVNGNWGAPLHVACKSQSEQSIAYLLDVDGIEVDALDDDSRTPLMHLFSGYSGSLSRTRVFEIVQLFLAKGASTSSIDFEESSLMHFAMLTWNAEIIQQLLETGLSIQAVNKRGQLPLHWLASSSFHFQKRSSLLPELNINSQAIIELVCKLSRSDCLDAVLSPRLPSATKSKEAPGGETKYHAFETLSHTSWFFLLDFLLDAGADVKGYGCYGESALHLCIERAASLAIIERLLELGANPYKTSRDGLDCFHIALLNMDVAGSMEILRCLRLYADIHPSPTHWLYKVGEDTKYDGNTDDEVTYYLEALRQKSAINQKNKFGRTLLFAASIAGKAEMVERLIAYGADVCALDCIGWTALHSAVQNEDSKIVRILLEAGADVGQAASDVDGSKQLPSQVEESPSEQRATTLQTCLKRYNRRWETDQSVEVVRILLEYGADPNDPLVGGNGYGELPLSLLLHAPGRSSSVSAVKRMLDTMELLVCAGARIVDVADHITIGLVAKMDRHEILWKEIQAQLVALTSSSVLFDEDVSLHSCGCGSNTGSCHRRLGDHACW
ncbi:ankyrin repeat domain protein [Fusarium beomiforme]|uniref:Ankyrin repeat domain protein n=1 Tax=Fusarium beomiforme TaxID=44412 RepID=A0A9P5AJ80_9HYPO|nr:ankyrin repeat domain protein [Fusarium beomiforme]